MFKTLRALKLVFALCTHLLSSLCCLWEALVLSPWGLSVLELLCLREPLHHPAWVAAWVPSSLSWGSADLATNSIFSGFFVNKKYDGFVWLANQWRYWFSFGTLERLSLSGTLEGFSSRRHPSRTLDLATCFASKASCIALLCRLSRTLTCREVSNNTVKNIWCKSRWFCNCKKPTFFTLILDCEKPTDKNWVSNQTWVWAPLLCRCLCWLWVCSWSSWPGRRIGGCWGTPRCWSRPETRKRSSECESSHQASPGEAGSTSNHGKRCDLG